MDRQLSSEATSMLSSQSTLGLPRPRSKSETQPSSVLSSPLISTTLGETSRAAEVLDPCGVPGRKPKLQLKDLYILTAQLCCFVVGILTVFWVQMAIYLGQVKQLIVLGFLLAVMALLLENRVKSTALIYAGSRKSTIQDLDALMRKDFFAFGIHWSTRFVLLSLLGLPLGLSVAYKTFTGGQTKWTVELDPGFFGFTAMPGKQRIGNGFSLITDLYTPFWTNPAVNRAYGFNLYIVDNDTAFIPDTPFPEYVQNLQSVLSGNQTLSLVATVNATVSQMVNPSAEERVSDDYWLSQRQDYGKDYVDVGDNGGGEAIWAGSGSETNYSSMFLAIWNKSNETFKTEAIRIEHTRRLAQAEWLITSSSISLVKASLVPNSIQPNQSVIQNSRLGLESMFEYLLGEFDWHNRAHKWYGFPYPLKGLNNRSSYAQPVNTVPALAGAMLWSRITSLNGLDREDSFRVTWEDLMGSSKPASDITTIKTYPTLKRSWVLALILFINPVLCIICFMIKSILYEAPIGDGFNSIAMLAAANAGDATILKGAALSGALKRRVYTTFAIANVDDEISNSARSKSIVMSLDARGESGRIEDQVVYW